MYGELPSMRSRASLQSTKCPPGGRSGGLMAPKPLWALAKTPAPGAPRDIRLLRPKV